MKLDAEAQTRLEALSTAVGRLPTQVLRHLMAWALHHSEAWRVDRQRVEDPTAAIVVRFEPEVRTRVHAPARATGGDASAWGCDVLSQMTLADLPVPWQTGEAEPRSHDSCYYGKRDLMRLDDPPWERLEERSSPFQTSIAEVIRHLVAHANIEDVPPSWHRAVDAYSQGGDA